jgi:hypothetical protein
VSAFRVEVPDALVEDLVLVPEGEDAFFRGLSPSVGQNRLATFARAWNSKLEDQNWKNKNADYECHSFGYYFLFTVGRTNTSIGT